MDTYIDYLQQALIQVDAWDLPEAEFAQAVNDQARLMAGMSVDWAGEIPESDHRMVIDNGNAVYVPSIESNR